LKVDRFMLRPGRLLRFTLPLAVMILVLLAAPVRADSDTFSWKPVEGALLKINGRALFKWGVYTADKKYQFLLILLMHRYLILDTKARTVYELKPGALEHEGTDLRTPKPDSEIRRIPSSQWYFHDMGPLEQVRLRLDDYGGNTIEMQLPHMPDLRGLY
jgi:hypothetical protein